METTAVPKKKPSRKKRLPQTDVDLAAVAAKAVSVWAANDWLKIQWITQPELQQVVEQYANELSGRMQAGASRPAISAALLKSGRELDKGIQYLKGYLFDKYGTHAKDHYHAFGLVRIGDAFKLPRDQHKKMESLTIMIQAIASEGFNERKYGKTYWLEKTATYQSLIAQAADIDANVSSKVGHKNLYRNTIERALNSILYTLRANFPDTYAYEIRSWGFHKEKY